MGPAFHPTVHYAKRPVANQGEKFPWKPQPDARAGMAGAGDPIYQFKTGQPRTAANRFIDRPGLTTCG